MPRPAALFALILAIGSTGCLHRPAVAPPAPPAIALQRDLAAIFEAPEFSRSIWSVLVRPLNSTENLYALNASRLVMPGSNMKILTLAAAADRLGWDYRFETKVAAIGSIENGVLKGDLFVIGSGDPSISERSDEKGILRTMAQQVRDAGIREIEGRIIGDDDAFDDQELGDGWAWDNLAYGYSAPVTALEYNEGSVDLAIRAGNAAGDPVDVQMSPDGSGLELENRLTTVGESGTGAMTMERLPGSPHLILRGQIPAKAARFVRTASVDNPTQFFANAFRNALVAAGVQVGKGAVDMDYVLPKPDLSGAKVITSRKSPPLSQIASSMMKVSQNQYGEILLKALGGKQVERDALKARGISEDSFVIADGSGLSRYNYVTDEALVAILQSFRQKQPDGGPFTASLALVGKDGTLARRLTGTLAEGRIRAKSGTIDNVRAISGFVEDAEGETLVFSIIANNFAMPVAQIDAAADKALLRLVSFKR